MTKITEHKWSDESVMDAEAYDGIINIGLWSGCGSIDINESDAIAIARYFGLTERDIVERPSKLDMKDLTDAVSHIK